MKHITDHMRTFDKQHGWSWENLPVEQRMRNLQFSLIALQEELGEIAGPTKKLLRKTSDNVTEQDFAQLKEQISEEVIDIFIYTMKLAELFEIDLEKGYFEKMEKNEKKFSAFRKS